MTIKSAQTLVADALKEIKTISPSEALQMSNDDKCNLIDIRDVRELENLGRIENSNHIPRGMLEFWMDPDSPYFKEALKAFKVWGKKKFMGKEFMGVIRSTFVIKNNKIIKEWRSVKVKDHAKEVLEFIKKTN